MTEPSSWARAKAFNALTRHPDCIQDDVALGDLIDEIATTLDEARSFGMERSLLERCRTVLGNMALENKGAIFKRWPINHEPLRADAKGLLPLIDEALGNDAFNKLFGAKGASAGNKP